MVLGALAPAVAGGRPIARIACAPTATNCTESGSINLPGDSFGSQSTDTTPSGASSASSLFDASDLATFDSMWEGVVEGYPTLSGVKNIFVKRTITCVIFARAADFTYASFKGIPPQSPEIASATVYVLALQACLEAIVSVQKPVGPSPDAAAAKSGCDQATISVPIMLKRSGKGFAAQITGPSTKATGRPPLIVSCARTRTGIKLGLKPRARGRKLRSVVGPKLSVAFANPSSKPVTVSSTYTFK
jgi:hypothetical protein